MKTSTQPRHIELHNEMILRVGGTVDSNVPTHWRPFMFLISNDIKEKDRNSCKSFEEISHCMMTEGLIRYGDYGYLASILGNMGLKLLQEDVLKSQFTIQAIMNEKTSSPSEVDKANAQKKMRTDTVDSGPRVEPSIEKDTEQTKFEAQIEGAIKQNRRDVKFEDIAGLKGAKEAIEEAIFMPMKMPHMFKGSKPRLQRLVPSAVPSLFPWLKEKIDSHRGERILLREERKRKIDEQCQLQLEETFLEEHVGFQEVVCESECCETIDENIEENCEKITFDAVSQTAKTPLLSVENYRDNDEAMHFFTGLETYAKFIFVLNSLGPAAYCLNYIYFQVSSASLSILDQFFMTLIKLRQYKSNFELALMFSVSEGCVKNIVYTWILFMAKQWREVKLWPDQELVLHFAPADFKAKFPTTRVIVDGTECPIKKPKHPRAQRTTFSTYKNRNTIKVLVGSTPGGLFSYISQAYGGSTSDRQIVERSNLVSLCDPGDSIMADKGFNVQDIFATKNVMINIPTFFKKKNRMSGNTVIKDRKVSSKRVHIERLIGLGKTYKILTVPMNSTEAKLSSDITFVVFMLCNFRTVIVSKYA